MSGPIEVGKWAYVARGLRCCGRIHPMVSRLPFVVAAITRCELRKPSERHCVFCGAEISFPITIAYGYQDDPRQYANLEMLKRLDDPPAEESTETEQAVTA